MTGSSGKPSASRRLPRRLRRGHPKAVSATASDRIVIVKLEFEIDRGVWASGFTRRHPELVVEALNVMAVSGGNLLGEFDVHGQTGDFTEEIAAFPDVISVERSASAPDVSRYRVMSRMSPVFRLEQRYAVMVRYPAVSQDGVVKLELVGPLSRLRALMRLLHANGSNPRLVSLAPESLHAPQTQLTPTQQTLFRLALGSGYFDVPRRITLTQLARKVSRSKSSVSHLLAVVERKLAESA
jgi:predicted DNA binding protein